MQVHPSAALPQLAARKVEVSQSESEQSVAIAATPEALVNSNSPSTNPVSLPELTEAIGNINKAMQSLEQDLEFMIDSDSKRTIVKVIDQRTQEVIRQMPSAEALEIAKALDRVQGLLIRQKA